MTDHESETVRALFQDADLDHVPAPRDLIGPAVAWGNGRRRRDRWTAVTVTGAVAAVAVAGAVALRPGGGAGTDAVAPGKAARVQSSATATQSSANPRAAAATTPTLPPLTGTIAQREQEVLDALRPYLPAGVRIACQNMGPNPVCPTMLFTGPTGTSIGQWIPGTYDYQAAPVDAKYIHQHRATAAIPLLSGPVVVPGATVQVTSSDTEAQDNVSDKTTLTDPTALTFHTAVYEFIPTGAAAKAVSMELTELVREMPWKPGAEFPGERVAWGFNPNGPVLSPQQFATLAAAPIFPLVLQRLADLNQQAMDATTHAPSTSSR